MTPRVDVSYYAIRIFFGDVLHLHLARRKVVAIQSWRDGPANYSIEYTLDGGGTVLTEYDDADKWSAILAGLTNSGVLL